MKWLKAFVIGSSFLIFIIPLYAYFFGVSYLNPNTPFSPEFTPIGLPVMLGIMNIFCLYIGQKSIIKHDGWRYFLCGLVYGLFLATLGKLVFDLPNTLFEIPTESQYLVFIFPPLVYGLVCRFILKPLNKAFALE